MVKFFKGKGIISSKKKKIHPSDKYSVCMSDKQEQKIFSKYKPKSTKVVSKNPLRRGTQKRISKKIAPSGRGKKKIK